MLVHAAEGIQHGLAAERDAQTFGATDETRRSDQAISRIRTDVDPLVAVAGLSAVELQESIVAFVYYAITPWVTGGQQRRHIERRILPETFAKQNGCWPIRQQREGSRPVLRARKLSIQTAAQAPATQPLLSQATGSTTSHFRGSIGGSYQGIRTLGLSNALFAAADRE
jgi:hypothetical protein